MNPVMKMKQKAFSWSPSALKKFETCPRQYWHTYWNPNAVRGPDSEAILWGNDVHKAFELAVLNGDKQLPARFKVYQKWLDAVHSIPGDAVPERKVAFNRFWEEVDFFSPEAWVRLIVDLTIVNDDKGVVLDYKTGKSRYDNQDQLELSAMPLLSNPEINTFKTGYIYLKEDKNTFREYTRGNLERFQNKFEAKVAPMAQAVQVGVFNMKPSGLCKAWCDELTCPHNGKR